MPHIAAFDRPSRQVFQSEIQSLRRPAILRNIPIGPCVAKWTPEYLVEAVGNEKLCVVHESTSPRLRFLNKNFTYESMPFGEFMDKASRKSIEDNAKFYYYRALANQDPRRNVSGEFMIVRSIDWLIWFSICSIVLVVIDCLIDRLLDFDWFWPSDRLIDWPMLMFLFQTFARISRDSRLISRYRIWWMKMPYFPVSSDAARRIWGYGCTLTSVIMC